MGRQSNLDAVLVVTSYLPPMERLAELVTCLEAHIGNPHIAETHLIVEEEEEKYTDYLNRPNPILQRLKAALAHPTVKGVNVGHRTTYKDLFGYANKHLVGRTVILTNADIWYDGTLSNLVGVDLEGIFLAISRSERSGQNPTACSHSQDTWIFKAPIKEFPCDWPLGPRGSDNRLVYEADAAGYRVINPCYVIKPHHLHKSQHRVGVTTETLKGPLKYVLPGALPQPTQA